MLEPNDRRLLLESLRPPEGFHLDFAVATTFSLDLIALLTTPVAFTFYDWEHEDGRPVVDPLALLEALSRHADRFAIFCQADRIIVPRRAHGLFVFLEERVFPVRAPRPGGIFHPKIWALRYTDQAKTVRYRLLVSSRNLTFDRCWDTLLVLDGELEDRRVGHSYLRPLGEFLAAIPQLGLRPISDAVRARVGEMAEEIRRVRFDLPEHVDRVAFWPLGLGVGPDWPFRENGRRLLVISPFVTSGCLRRLADVADDRVLISDAVEMAKLGREGLTPIQDLRVLAQAAHTADPDVAPVDEPNVAPGPSGLHAKVYVLDQGREARIWTGSANATDAAFGGNVELLAELIGPKGRIGVDALLAERKGEPSFASLLEPYDPPLEPDRDEVAEALTLLIDSVRKALGAAPLSLHVTPEEDTYSLELRGPRPEIEPSGAEIAVTCRPITLGEGQAAALNLGKPVSVVFPKISFDALTSFVAFTLTAKQGSRVVEEQLALNLPLEGAPAGRRERIIQNLLRDQRSVIRFILMLLADDVDLSAAGFAKAGAEAGAFGLGFGEDTVLESLLRALVREPRRLDRVAQLLKDLQSGDDPLALPEAFAGVWAAVWSARQTGAP